MKTVRELIGDAKYEEIRQSLKEAFPDAKTIVTDQHVDAYALLVWNNLSDEDSDKVVGPRPDPFELKGLNAILYKQCQQDQYHYYVANAKHTRVVNPTHSFTGHLPLVRVPLADTDATSATIVTAIGDVDPRDRLFQSVEQVAFKYGKLLGYQPEKVDVVTPARSGGARFGAIALYLGYKTKSDAAPSFYILESGTATGNSTMSFISPDMKPIPPRKKWYVPTPFTDEESFYTGDLKMSGDEPIELLVHAYSKNMVKEVEVTVEYQKSPPIYVWPAILTAMAASRVGAISSKMGIKNFESNFAPAGFALDWDDPLK